MDRTRRRSRRPNSASRQPPKRSSRRSPPKPACYKYREQLIEAVAMPLEASPTTSSYRASLMVVFVLMLLLPAVYIVATAGLIWWLLNHYVNHAHLLSAGVLPAIAWILPALFGPLVIYFLLKPVFVSDSPLEKDAKLKRDEQPVLYEFVEQLAESVGAPRPAEIRVNNCVNASASLASGNPFSDRLTLTIGLPLVHGLTVRQLSGVLAHELGHFSQRSGMRISYVVRATNNWFLKALRTPTTTDNWLHGFFSGRTLFSKVMRWTLQALVYTAGCVLWVPYLLSNAICCLLIRQMELDADRVEAALVGSACFRETHKRMISLSVAEHLAYGDLSTFHDEGRLVDDFARLVAANVDQLTPELKQALDQHQKSERTQWFDTHPSQSDRFRNVRQVKTEPAIDLPDQLRKARANLLFDRADRISKGLTRRFYRQALGRQFRETTLYPAEELVERKQSEMAAQECLRRYFQVDMPVFYPIPIAEDADQPSESPTATVHELIRLRERMLKLAPRFRDLIQRYDRSEDNLLETAAAVTLESVGVAVRKPPVVLLNARQESAEEVYEVVEQAVSNLSTEMLEYEHAAGGRLSAAMQLLAHPQVAAKFEDGDRMQEEGLEYVRQTLAVTGFMGDVRALRVLCHRVVALLSHISDDASDRYMHTVFALLSTLSQLLHDLAWEMGDYEYPFEHAEGDKSLQEFVLPAVPEPNDIGGVLMVSRIAAERLATVQMRLFARLAVLAEKIERRMGLKPLDLPPAADERPSKSTSNRKSRSRSTSRRGDRRRSR